MPSIHIYVSDETIIRLHQAALDRGKPGCESELAEACVEENALMATRHIPFVDMKARYDKVMDVNAAFAAEERALIADEVADKAADEAVMRSE